MRENERAVVRVRISTSDACDRGCSRIFVLGRETASWHVCMPSFLFYFSRVKIVDLM